MAFPPEVGYGTVVGTFLDHAANPIKGQVIFTPSPKWVKNSTLPAGFVPKRVVVTLGVDGELPPTELVATDNPDDNPTGDWTYTVSFKFDCVGLESFAFELPAGTTVDLWTVIPVATSGGTPIIQGPPGPPGVVQSVVAGANVTVDDTDPANPIVSATGGGGGGAVDSVNGKTGAVVLDAGDVGAATAAQGEKADTAVQPAALADYAKTDDLGTAAFEAVTAFATSAQGGKADTAVQPGSLGTAAYQPTSAFATSAQGGKADTAVQPAALTDYAKTDDLGTAAFQPTSAFATAAQGGLADNAVRGVVAGTNVTVDDTDPLHPVVSASGGGGGGAVDSVNGKTGAVVLDAGDVNARADSWVPTLAELPDVGSAIDGKIDKVAEPTAGRLAALTGAGGVEDSGWAPADFATAAQGGKADTAVQPAALTDYAKTDDLGTAAFQPSTAFATSTQGGKADTAVQPGSLSAVATSGAYSDLGGKPTIPSTPGDIGAATAAQGEKADTALQPGFVLPLAAATETLGHVEIDDDGSSTTNWPDRLAFYFKPNGGTATATSWFNEYGELRIQPGKVNTVALRVFTKPTSGSPSHTGDVFQIQDDRDNRNVLFGIDGSGNVVIVGTVTAPNIGPNRIQSGDTEPSSPAVGDMWADMSA